MTRARIGYLRGVPKGSSITRIAEVKGLVPDHRLIEMDICKQRSVCTVEQTGTHYSFYNDIVFSVGEVIVRVKDGWKG